MGSWPGTVSNELFTCGGWFSTQRASPTHSPGISVAGVKDYGDGTLHWGILVFVILFMCLKAHGKEVPRRHQAAHSALA